MKSLLSIILCSILLSPSVIAQIDVEVTTSYEELLATIVNQYNAVGISAAVRVGDNTWAGVAGISAVGENLTVDHTFGMGSATKTFVSATILQLMEEGELELTDPISDYLPAYDHIPGSLTIKQLLYHTSGLYNYTAHPTFVSTIFNDLNHQYTPEEVLTNFLEDPIAEPETEQSYSNTNYLLLGMIIKSITGNEFYDEITERFNTVSNYPSISMPPFQTAVSDMAHLWLDTTLTGTEPLVDCVENGWILNSFFSAAASAGALAATPSDLANWAYHLYSGNLLEPTSMDSLFNTHPLLLNGIIPYGLGVLQAPFGCGTSGWGHGGNIIYTTSMYYLPEYDLSLVVMTNDGNQLINVGTTENVANELACIYIDFVNNVGEMEQHTAEVYPNPSNGVFNVLLPDAGQIQSLTIVDLSGKSILETTGPMHETSSFDLTGIPAGTYLMLIQSESRLIRKKLLIMPD